MKISGFILAFYLLLLAAIPCCAIDNCPDDKTEQTADHEKGDNDCGTCSPFFSCEGCATASLVFQNNHYELIPTNFSTVYSGYLLSPLSEISPDFWQPPKLG